MLPVITIHMVVPMPWKYQGCSLYGCRKLVFADVRTVVVQIDSILLVGVVVDAAAV